MRQAQLQNNKVYECCWVSCTSVFVVRASAFLSVTAVVWGSDWDVAYIALAGVCRLVVFEEQWKRKWKMIGVVMCGLDYRQGPPESWSLLNTQDERRMQINHAYTSSSNPTEIKTSQKFCFHNMSLHIHEFIWIYEI